MRPQSLQPRCQATTIIIIIIIINIIIVIVIVIVIIIIMSSISQVVTMPGVKSKNIKSIKAGLNGNMSVSSTSRGVVLWPE